MSKVLIVDDDKTNRELIKYSLRDCEIFEANSGKEALKIISDIAPDLILLDQRMPEMDGLTTLDALLAKNPDWKCMMITAEGTLQLGVEALKRGAIDFLVKPFDPFILKYSVERLLKYIFLEREKKYIEEQRTQEQKEYQKHLEEEVSSRTNEAVEARLKAEKANASKSEFLANMSHELKTPLHSILSFSNFGIKKITKSRNRAGKEELLEYFQEIKSSGDRLFKLLNELFDLSKFESGRSLYSFKEKQLSIVIEGLVEEMARLYKGKSPNIIFNKPDFDDTIEMDSEKISQAVKNLLSNALRFSPEGQEIFLNIYEGKKGILFSIEDKGIGVPDEEEKDIFSSFVQSSRSKNGSGGTGLGLSIAKNIIQGHQGRIWVEPNSGGGAIFRFTVPKKQD